MTEESVARPEASGRVHQAARATAVETVLLVITLLSAFACIVWSLLWFWPGASTDGESMLEASFAGIPLSGVHREGRWFVLVMAAGALGSFIHAATSAGDYIGNDKLVGRWLYWYLLRLPVGASLALLMYLLLRGGVLTGVQLQISADAQPFGIVGLAALAGMFSKKATNKLGEVFDAMFKTDKDAQLGDKLERTRPAIEWLVPEALDQGAAAATLLILGKNFPQGARVLIDGAARTPESVSENKIVLKLSAEDLAQERTCDVRVETSDAEPRVSDPMRLTIKKPHAGE